MLCRVCNTRIPQRRSSCPNCGSNSIFRSPATEPAAGGKLPPQGVDGGAIDQDTAAAVELENTLTSASSDDTEEVDVELEDAVDDGARGPDTNIIEALASDDTVGIEELEAHDEMDPDEKDEPPAVAVGGEMGAAGCESIDTAGLRSLLADQPELLEPGLRVYTNEKGTPLGAGYTSAVGEIDLLARDADGGFVVVMVADRFDAERLVSNVLQRIGWVRKHLSQDENPVRAIVLLDDASDDIAYAAAAISGTVAFKTWRVSVTFDDIEF